MIIYQGVRTVISRVWPPDRMRWTMNMRCIFLCCMIILLRGGTSGYQLLYPYSAENGDQRGPQEDDQGLQRNLVMHHTYYGEDEHVIWVNENGVLSYFDEFFDNSPRPFAALPQSDGPRIIAPFWGDHGIFGGDSARIWYREVKDKKIIFPRATLDVIYAFPDAYNFVTKRVFIATWEKVMSFFGADNREGRRKKRQAEGNKVKPTGRMDCEACLGENTYQVVIIVGKKSKECYVMFNYEDIQWITGFPNEATQVGFQSGFGEIFNLDLGENTTVRDLPLYTNVGIAGRYMFRVSGSEIEPAGPNVRAPPEPNVLP